jgi:hypothetical protein
VYSVYVDFSANNIIAGIIFGLFGLLLFKEGKKRTDSNLYFIGLALIVYPYMITDALLVWIVGFVLTAVAIKMLQP